MLHVTYYGISISHRAELLYIKHLKINPTYLLRIIQLPAGVVRSLKKLISHCKDLCVGKTAKYSPEASHSDLAVSQVILRLIKRRHVEDIGLRM